jgi:nicotinic acid mononucleotide adenylyltransferase
LLKLVFYTKDSRLKVRPGQLGDNFASACIWQDKLQFIVSDNGDFMMIWTSLLPDLDPEYAEALVDLVGARYPISKKYKNLLNGCPEMIFQNEKDEWVFFGGTFDPWHNGHQSCLNLIPEDVPCLIVPDQNPHKNLREISLVSTILQISTKAKFKKFQYLVPTFLLEHKQNPTVEWVARMKDELPSSKVSLLMGFDSFSQLKTWTRSSELLPMLFTVYVVSRMEDDQDRLRALDEAHAMNSSLNVVFLGRHEFETLSSTEIRSWR